MCTRLVLELLHSLHGAVVVVEVDRAHHLAALDVADAQADAADHVAVHQLHDLRRRRELRVDLRAVVPVSSYLIALWVKIATSLLVFFFISHLHCELKLIRTSIILLVLYTNSKSVYYYNSANGLADSLSHSKMLHVYFFVSESAKSTDNNLLSNEKHD